MAGEVARAYVSIIPSMEGSQKEISDQLNEAAGNAGTSAGKTMGENLGSSASKSLDFSKVGTSLTKSVTVPIMAVGTASVAAFNEVDAGLDIIVTKTGATGEALEAMQDSAKNIANTIPTSFEKAGEAVGEVNTRFGITGEELEDLSGQFIKFAELNGTDVTNSVDSVQAAMAAFGVETGSAGDVLDILNKAGQDTGVSVLSLASDLTRNSAALTEMGFGINTASGFLANLNKNGIDSSTVMTGMRKALQNATKEGKTMDEALSDMTDSIKNASTETEAMQIASDLFGTKAGPALAKAVRDGRLSFDGLTNAVTNYGDSVTETFENTLDAPDQMTVALNNLKTVGADLAGELMTDLAPVIKDAAEGLRDFGEWFKGLDPNIKKAIGKVALFAAGLGPVLSITGKVSSGISGLKGAFDGLAGISGKVTGAVSDTSSQISGSVSGGGFAALKNFLSQDISTATGTFSGALGTVGAAIGTFTASYSLTTWVLEQTGAMEKLQDWATSTKLNLFDFAGGNSGGWDERYEQACQKVEAASSGLYTLTSADLQELGAVEQHYSEQSTKWYNINKSESEARAGTMTQYTALAETLMAQEGAAAGTLAQAHADASASMSASAQDTAANVSASSQQVSSDFGALSQTVGMESAAMNAAISTNLAQADTAAQGKAASIDTNITNAVTDSRNNVLNGFTQIKSDISSGMGAAESDVRSKGNAIKDEIRSDINSASSSAQTGFNKISSAVSSNMSQSESKVGSAVSQMKSHFEGAGWPSVGTNAMEGIKGGISGAIGGLVDAAANAAKSMLDAAKNALGIASPSKEFRDEIGRFIPPGIAEGIEAQTSVAVEAVQASVDLMTGSIHLPSPEDYLTHSPEASGGLADAGSGGEADAPWHGGDIIIPVYIGREHIQDIVVSAQRINDYRSGGR